MRKTFSDAVEQMALKDDKILFMTCDVGFNAFENLQAKLGNRFINAGVAEQNMIGVASGLAYKGYKVFCYCIAPFIVFRCLEQFRNDVCFHKLPVFIVGNGGGYDYGIMGPSHHALEDLACLSGLPGITCWVPSSKEDIGFVLAKITTEKKPAYLRLAKDADGALPRHAQTGNFIQHIHSAHPCGSIFVMGPVVRNVLQALAQTRLTGHFNVFSCLSLPLHFIPPEIEEKLMQGNNLVVVEEQVSAGGLSQSLALYLLENNIKVKNFISLHAKGYPGGTFGSRQFHLKESGLDIENIARVIRGIISEKKHPLEVS